MSTISSSISMTNMVLESESVSQASSSSFGNIDIVGEAGKTKISKEEYARAIKTCIDNNKLKDLKNILNNLEGEELAYVLNIYRANNDVSLLMALQKLSETNSEAKAVEETLRKSASKHPYISNENLASDLLKALNGNDTEQIKTLLNQINDSNICNVFGIYEEITQKIGERADGKSPRNVFEKFWIDISANNATTIRGYDRRETVLQGIINNKILSLEEKRENLTKLFDTYLQYARNKNISEVKFDDKQVSLETVAQKGYKYIEIATEEDDSKVSNALNLENLIHGIYKEIRNKK